MTKKHIEDELTMNASTNLEFNDLDFEKLAQGCWKILKMSRIS